MIQVLNERWWMVSQVCWRLQTNTDENSSSCSPRTGTRAGNTHAQVLLQLAIPCFFILTLFVCIYAKLHNCVFKSLLTGQRFSEWRSFGHSHISSSTFLSEEITPISKSRRDPEVSRLVWICREIRSNSDRSYGGTETCRVTDGLIYNIHRSWGRAAHLKMQCVR